MDAKKTPLYDEHLRLGGKIVDYAGWALPVQYEGQGLVVEHEAVRNTAGLFDVSHMGEIKVTGKESTKFLDFLLTNDISKMVDAQIIYTFMAYETGGVVDDLLVYKFGDEDYLLVVNAANVCKDFDWILKQKGKFDVAIDNISDEIGEVALQGPLAQKILQKLTNYDLNDVKFFHLANDVDINGVKCLISRTGYTGEDGFEIYTDNQGIVKVWKDILESGKEEGIKPTGLGCRDTLRFEAALPLYGHEISQDINPLEGDFKFFVKLKKDSNFIGKEALNKYYNDGMKRKLVGFELTERGIPREGYEVYKDGERIGHVTTGYLSPTLKKNIGNALIDIRYAKLGEQIDIKIRNKYVKAKIIDRKFLKK